MFAMKSIVKLSLITKRVMLKYVCLCVCVCVGVCVCVYFYAEISKRKNVLEVIKKNVYGEHA